MIVFGVFSRRTDPDGFVGWLSDMDTFSPLRSAQRSRTHTGRLLRVLEQLEEIEADLIGEGLREAAGSLATVIADLLWQCEELLVREEEQQSNQPEFGPRFSLGTGQ